MLKRLRVENYKSLVDFAVTFESELTVLVGGAGTGKSSVVDVLEAIMRTARGDSIRDCFPPWSLSRFGIGTRQRIVVEAELPVGQFEYSLVVEHGPRGDVGVISETLTHDEVEYISAFRSNLSAPLMAQLKAVNDSFGFQISPASDESLLAFSALPPGPATQFREFAANMIVAAPNGATFEQISTTPSGHIGNDRRLHAFGAWLRALTADLSAASTLLALMADRIDGFRSLKTVEVSKGNYSVMATVRLNNMTAEMELRDLSDGQRQMLALYALVVAAKTRGALLVVDEPENFLALAAKTTSTMLFPRLGMVFGPHATT